MESSRRDFFKLGAVGAAAIAAGGIGMSSSALADSGLSYPYILLVYRNGVDMPIWSGMNRSYYDSYTWSLTVQSIKNIQRRLGLRQTGSYDSATTASVKNFQRINHLTQDGKVGPATAAKMGLKLAQ